MGRLKRYRISRFTRVSFHVGCLPNTSGIVDATMRNLHFTQIGWAKCVYMETHLKSSALFWYYYGINSIMTHVPISSAKVRRNSSPTEWLWQTLDMSNVFMPKFGLKKSQ